MGAAFEAGEIAAGLGQHCGGDFYMRGLAGVRGAGEREFGRGEAQAIGGAGSYQWQGLQGFDGAARENRIFEIAAMGHDGAGGVGHHVGAEMLGFDHLAAGDFGEESVLHGVQRAKTGRVGQGENGARVQASGQHCVARRHIMKVNTVW